MILTSGDITIREKASAEDTSSLKSTLTKLVNLIGFTKNEKYVVRMREYGQQLINSLFTVLMKTKGSCLRIQKCKCLKRKGNVEAWLQVIDNQITDLPVEAFSLTCMGVNHCSLENEDAKICLATLKLNLK